MGKCLNCDGAIKGNQINAIFERGRITGIWGTDGTKTLININHDNGFKMDASTTLKGATVSIWGTDGTKELTPSFVGIWGTDGTSVDPINENDVVNFLHGDAIAIWGTDGTKILTLTHDDAGTFTYDISLGGTETILAIPQFK